MTFTKGVGTPTYMAPEVPNKQKFEKSADIFSLAVTMFECFKWGEAYPKAFVKFSWDIITLVSSEKGLQRPRDGQ